MTPVTKKSKLLICGTALFACLLFPIPPASDAAVGDKITSIKLNVYQAADPLRVNGNAVLHAEFFGTRKRGFLDRLLGLGRSETTNLQSSEWKIEIVTPNGGVLSKPFLYQKEPTGKGGITGLISQAAGVIASKDAVLYTAPPVPGIYKVRLTEGSLKSEVSLKIVPGPGGTEDRMSFPNPEMKGPYAEIVQRYAPFIAQETWFQPKADYITRFDYDGNWSGDDNWENLERGSSQAFVYYAVMETETHWFLHYNFFHPRDYSDACIAGTCHENDYEGMIVSVRKDGSRFGVPELVETLAHNNVYTFTNDSRIQKGVHDIDGALVFYEQTHPVIFIEAGGHGVFGSEARNSLFDAEKMEFRSSTGVTYRFKSGEAETPKSGNDRNVGYALLSVGSEFWERGSGTTDEPNETFENFFVYQPSGGRPLASQRFLSASFKGRTASDSKARPFWGWQDRRTERKKLLARGQWALDPAYSISICYKWPADLPVATEYIYNPFLNIPNPGVAQE